MQLTSHAQRRLKQRSIPGYVATAIYWYGTEYHAPGCARKLKLTSADIQLAVDDNPSLRGSLERYRNAYLITGQAETVITAARQARRIIR